ncbi:glycosyltransferase family 9 protein [Noviherbaspirillum pedocola]|uniref:Uncharacterized protein n=1 Tax=Noviherbaspirillum pedocola TaxID=2801341 RepID=A0A934SZ35_9BURK|nr:hypothetical protein [Noviherbaspirillum pedocola]MBK4735602.1 hypothetical protein [Noviherbaspirillum pedocola]
MRLTLSRWAESALTHPSSAALANSTDPVHMAAAIGTPLGDLYAHTNLQHTPWRVVSRMLHHEALCRNCYTSMCPEGHHDWLVKVKPGRVVDALGAQLRKPGADLRGNC